MQATLKQTEHSASASWVSQCLVPRREVATLWPFISDGVTGALRKAQSPYRAHEVLDWLLSGDCQLWVFGQGQLFVISFIDERGVDRVVQIFLAAGDLSGELLDQAEDAIETMGRAMGCTAIEAEGRVGWERRLKSRGWQRKWVTLRKDL